jgi:chromosome partitioning protein
MPTIAFVSAKGGVGKTTSALLLALGLAEKGLDVALVDSDPNLPLTAWAKLPGKPEAVAVFEAPHFADLPAALRSAKRAADWVVVDTEGGAPRIGGLAVANADLVITPLAASRLEVREAIKAAKLTSDIAGRERRAIPFTGLFARTPGAHRKSFSAVRDELSAEGLAILSTVLSDKEAFKTIFDEGGDLSCLKPRQVSGLAAARALVAAFAEEVSSLFETP